MARKINDFPVGEEPIQPVKMTVQSQPKPTELKKPFQMKNLEMFPVRMMDIKMNSVIIHPVKMFDIVML